MTIHVVSNRLGDYLVYFNLFLGDFSFNYVFYNFHPDPWGNGNDSYFDKHIFQMGGSTAS